MQIATHSLFPVEVYEFKFSYPEIEALIKEVGSKKKEIKKISSLHLSHAGHALKGDDYFTDYEKPIRMLEYEKLFLMLSNYFQNKGYDFNMGYYWTTFYKNNANHGAHTHHGEHDSRKENNYSSVISLNTAGATRLLSPHLSSNITEYNFNSDVGKLIIFPANIWHDSFYYRKEERIVIASNLKIYKTQ